MTATDPPRANWKKLALPLTVGGVSGFLASLAFLRLSDLGPGPSLGVSREIGGLVGVLYVLIGLIVLFGVLRPDAGARLLNVEDAEELREQRRQLTYSAFASMAFGSALALLATSGAGLWIGASTGTLLAAVLVATACALSVAMTRHADELQRTLSKDATGSAFNLLFFVGGGWALLAHSRLLAAPEPIDWLTMFAAALLLGALWQVARRGMLLRGPN